MKTRMKLDKNWIKTRMKLDRCNIVNDLFFINDNLRVLHRTSCHEVKMLIDSYQYPSFEHH